MEIFSFESFLRGDIASLAWDAAVSYTHLMSARLEKEEYAVIPGFYGAMPDGTVHTFSRGGSDITGSIVAKAVHAEVYENWTDVSGFLIADPRIIPNPVGIDLSLIHI